MMMDFSTGRWAVIPGYDGVYQAEAQQIVSATPKLIKYSRHATWARQVSKSDVIATFGDKQDADRLAQSLNGVRGERNRRIQAAHLAAKQQADALIAAARQESAS